MVNKNIDSNTGAVGMSFGTVIFIVLLILKVTGVASFSWLIVFLPLIIEAALFVAIVLGVSIYLKIKHKM